MKITSIYSKPEVISQMQEFFEKEAFIQLTQFLDEPLEILKGELKKTSLKQIYSPLETRKQIVNTKELYNPEILKYIEYFRSKEFLSKIEEITQFELQFKSLEVNSYGHKDFLVLNDNQKREEIIEVIFDISDEWNESFGGITTYTTRDEEVFYIDPLFGALTILYKPLEVMKYVKYINNKAKDKRITRIEIKFEMVD